MRKQRQYIGLTWAIATVAFALLCCRPAMSADSVQVSLDSSKAAPRQVEPLTERSILRDYKSAWTNLAQALESNSIAPLNGSFTGTANAWLNEAIVSQRSSGLTSRYSNQIHHLEAVFYAPEGDVIELHDTASYHLQILDGNTTVHDEQVTVHYVVLMTPASDRWVVRQLQSTPQF